MLCDMDDDIVCSLTAIWEEVLHTRPIGPKDDFFDLGGDSLAALQLLDRVRAMFRRDLPMTALLSATTPERLARAIRGVSATAPRPAVVPLSGGDEGLPFFCMPGSGGSVFNFRALAQRLEDAPPFYGVQFHGTGRQAGIPHTIEAIANHLAQEVQDAYPRGPYLLGGYSFGGRVAFEMARCLHSAGWPVALLVLIDTWGPGFPRILSPVHRLALHAREFQRLGSKAKLRYALDRASALARRWHHPTHSHSEGPKGPKEPGADESASAVAARVREANAQATRLYRPRPFSGRLTLLRAERQPQWLGADSRDPHLGWGALAMDGIEVHPIPGDHLDLFDERNIEGLAHALNACLRSARYGLPTPSPSGSHKTLPPVNTVSPIAHLARPRTSGVGPEKGAELVISNHT
jgi:thioesterase domain-containing protein/acyl carrier protein